MVQTAVHQGWGGDDGEAIGRWMPGVVAELFQKPQVFHDELEDFVSGPCGVPGASLINRGCLAR